MVYFIWDVDHWIWVHSTLIAHPRLWPNKPVAKTLWRLQVRQHTCSAPKTLYTIENEPGAWQTFSGFYTAWAANANSTIFEKS